MAKALPALKAGDKVRWSKVVRAAGLTVNVTSEFIFEVVEVDGAIHKVKHPITGAVSAVARKTLSLV